jgi:hypothetical protein
MTKLLVTNIGTEIDLADASAHGIYVGENRLTYRDCDGDLRIYERRNGSLPTSAGDWCIVIVSAPSGPDSQRR